MDSFRRHNCMQIRSLPVRLVLILFLVLVVYISVSTPSKSSSVAIASTSGTSVTACIESFTEDFSTDPNLSDHWHIYRYANNKQNEAVWDAQNGVFYLTRSASDSGVATFTDYQLLSTRWIARFKYRSGGGSGADGLVFMFYKDEMGYGRPGYGGFLGFQYAFGNGIPGYGVEFDNFYNPGDGIGDPSERHIAIIQNKAGNHLKYVNDERTEDDEWHNVVVHYTDGLIVVSVDDQVTLEHQLEKPMYFSSGVGFSSATALYNNHHIIDNFTIQADCSASINPSRVHLPFIRR